MTVIPSGGFLMGDTLGNGSAYEKPVHPVQVKRFALARYETTQAEWNACVDARVCTAAAESSDNKSLPVVGVTWNQVQIYSQWLSLRTGARYRLPSEAEWEYAARAGVVAAYSWEGGADQACRHANVFDQSGRHSNPQWYWSAACDDGYAKAAPVGQFPPNPWGLYDMVGNVWEWVADCWNADYESAPDNGSAWTTPECSKRVNRGGGWGNPVSTMRLSNRDGDPQNAQSDALGFRIARDVDE
jgi:formylglycine-generating enzyme required for sulfatase activity